MDQQLITIIAEELGLRWNQVKNTIELLDADNTVPFIARYRKEVTGSMDEEQIRAVWERTRYLRNLEERKQTILKSIAEQGKLTPELEEKIKAATKLQDVEDLYLPYKPKRRTRATVAKEKGLEPLAEMILKQDIVAGLPEEYAAHYIDVEKGVLSAEEALAGARDIVAEVISENADIRKLIRERTQEKGLLVSQARHPEDVGEYEVYKDFSESLKTIPAYRILAINRGEREKYLRAEIDIPQGDMVAAIEAVYVTNPRSIFTIELRTAIEDSYRRLIAPAIERELRHNLTERADEHAIDIFARNLRALLMTPPLKNQNILGIDPGYRTGCKIAAIDTTGKYLEGATIYPHPPQKQWEEAKKIVQDFIERHHIGIIAIGNGTASRETEQLVAELIGEIDRQVFYTIVNEAGASVYSASEVAKKEFPDLDASMRGNISIARRLLDPMSELVKIDPQSIGVGLYQHDVNQGKLSEALDHVVESAVNQVGVDLNTASASLLRYVAGVNSRVAENIVKQRENIGKFVNREQLKKVNGLGENAFVQAAGFLRIRESDIFFDSTAVHPESYGSAQKLLENLDLTIADVKANGALVRAKIKMEVRRLDDLAHLCGCGKETLVDIVDSLEKPNRDPRDNMPQVILRSDVLSINDLSEGMILKGTVRNVVDFGAFVDIGVKQDGLVHLSRMAKRYVKNPLDVVSVGDIVDVKVINIDKERHRIGLSMVLD
ncbi:RNA-binding transcriptional accessory protein [candidate division KSB1 bacterium]|nr:RNA-binding transcriptional accessory protein [candidate division KSB1 bacterium]RQW00230.1 MAG: RNA-binding transcriptional accessory protein [candidate division KSB1 bacterium]